jgi:hypothetical protein
VRGRFEEVLAAESKVLILVAEMVGEMVGSRAVVASAARAPSSGCRHTPKQPAVLVC